MKDQTEVCPLSRGATLPKAQPLFLPLQEDLRFFRPPLPAALSADLTARFPSREGYGLTKFRLRHTDGVGALYPPVVLAAHVTGHVTP
jgi:hypothetical protein